MKIRSSPPVDQLMNEMKEQNQPTERKFRSEGKVRQNFNEVLEQKKGGIWKNGKK